MSVPPLRLCNQLEPYISGEVNVHPSAVIAPGVILQAAPNSKIIIGPGVCIGMGSVFNVHQGTLIVGEGANIGSGFLMIGAGKIGENTCIGSATTVFNCSIESGIVIAPGSIIGDRSRKIIFEEEYTSSTSLDFQETSQPESLDDKQVSNDKVELESVQENVVSKSSTFTSTKQYFRTSSKNNQSSKLGTSVENITEYDETMTGESSLQDGETVKSPDKDDIADSGTNLEEANAQELDRKSVV